LTINYYDDRARLVQSASQNHLGGTDYVTNTYSFVGELLTSKREHKASASGAVTTLLTTNTYDHVGRLKDTKHKVNAQAEVVLAKLEYNEIGQLKNKKLHSENNGTSFINSTTYSYNERGWTNKSSSSHFTYELKYNTGTNAQYNGNIAQQLWGHGSTSTPNVYSYTYDPLNRLKTGVSTGTVMSEALSYDDMGNIKTLKRDNGTEIVYDYLVNNVASNRLQKLTGGLTGTYSYDANGNALTDRTGMAFTYNHLNLPKTATKTGTSVTYLYDAAGSKLRKTAVVGSTTTIRDYVGGIEYSKVGTGAQAIEMIHIGEGYLQRSGTNYIYHYNLTDHLGNVRVTLQRATATTGTIIQKHDYYPFGKSKALSISGINKYLYNGKEVQEELSGQQDYGARFYDAEIGRWNVIDPLAEQYRRWSPYNYTMNNPIRFIDPDGMSVSPIYDVNGDFLGTDEDGLQGQAVVMKKENFVQGMSREDAEKHSTYKEGDPNVGFESKEAALKYANHYSGLSSRPDYDGYLTLGEANDWYRNGNGEPLYVNASKIDLSPVTTGYLQDKGGSDYFNFFLTSNLETGLVYGTIKLTLEDPSSGQVSLGTKSGKLDFYDFDIKPGNKTIGRAVRNLGTHAGKALAGQGKGYEIYRYGYGKVGAK